MIFVLPFPGISGEGEGVPESRIDENKNPRFSELTPKAWEGLSMEVVVSDFQHSDGIFSSFICDEIIRRLSLEPLDTLQALSQIDKDSRTNAFKICFHPEQGEGSAALVAIKQYSNKYPELVKEINDAADGRLMH
jgi:hypothetical protein